MNHDIGDLLRSWSFDQDEINARRIRANDGSEKLQIRIDMGILQLETQGRPDGQRPHDSESLLEHYRTLLEDEQREPLLEGEDEGFSLDEEACGELFQEAWQYYHRYLSLFQLEDYQGVIADTRHNLDIFYLVLEYADNDEIKWYCEQYYPHAVMMQARAQGMLALEDDDYPAALKHVRAGIESIEEFLAGWEGEEEEEEFPELSFLQDWYEELEQERPLSRREELERALKTAVEAENFEEAARLRDKLSILPDKLPIKHPGLLGPSPKTSR
jgi:hypothetical protein